jgi:hypothetical protein
MDSLFVKLSVKVAAAGLLVSTVPPSSNMPALISSKLYRSLITASLLETRHVVALGMAVLAKQYLTYYIYDRFAGHSRKTGEYREWRSSYPDTCPL